MDQPVYFHATYGPVTVEKLLPDGMSAWVLDAEDNAALIGLDELTLPLEEVA